MDFCLESLSGIGLRSIDSFECLSDSRSVYQSMATIEFVFNFSTHGKRYLQDGPRFRLRARNNFVLGLRLKELFTAVYSTSISKIKQICGDPFH